LHGRIARRSVDVNLARPFKAGAAIGEKYPSRSRRKENYPAMRFILSLMRRTMSLSDLIPALTGWAKLITTLRVASTAVDFEAKPGNKS
jgi:hypothetical protein